MELVEPSWCVIGEGRVVNCDICRIDGNVLVVRVRHGTAIIRARRANTIEEGQKLAADWHVSALAQGFKNVHPM